MSKTKSAGLGFGLAEFKRARGYHLYTRSGDRFVDLDLCGGRAVWGHAAKGMARRIKNSISQGIWSRVHTKQARQFCKLFFQVFSCCQSFSPFFPDRFWDGPGGGPGGGLEDGSGDGPSGGLEDRLGKDGGLMRIRDLATQAVDEKSLTDDAPFLWRPYCGTSIESLCGLFCGVCCGSSGSPSGSSCDSSREALREPSGPCCELQVEPKPGAGVVPGAGAEPRYEPRLGPKPGAGLTPGSPRLGQRLAILLPFPMQEAPAFLCWMRVGNAEVRSKEAEEEFAAFLAARISPVFLSGLTESLLQLQRAGMNVRSVPKDLAQRKDFVLVRTPEEDQSAPEQTEQTQKEQKRKDRSVLLELPASSWKQRGIYVSFPKLDDSAYGELRSIMAAHFFYLPVVQDILTLPPYLTKRETSHWSAAVQEVARSGLFLDEKS